MSTVCVLYYRSSTLRVRANRALSKLGQDCVQCCRIVSSCILTYMHPCIGRYKCLYTLIHPSTVYIIPFMNKMPNTELKFQAVDFHPLYVTRSFSKTVNCTVVRKIA